MINVTKTFLPPLEEYQAILSRAWESGWMTNRGVLVHDLEKKLKEYLGISNIITTANGTLPLQIAIKTLKLKGEIITTPYSYIASVSSIVWECCTPVFVDINSDFLTIDETKIQDAITPRTTAILATHVYGNPCDVERIDEIARQYNLKVIYDAAHCFGVRFLGQSVFNFGDVSTCSFHATKLYHTGEGGMMITKDDALNQELFYHHNFGHKGKEHFHGLGINAKMSELQAALGLAMLPYVDTIIASRKHCVEAYKDALNTSGLRFLEIRPQTDWNYSYFPVIFEYEEQLHRAKAALEREDIYPRRYFYPSLNRLEYVNQVSCPNSEQISSTVLCLPLYVGLELQNIKKICDLIKNTL